MESPTSDDENLIPSDDEEAAPSENEEDIPRVPEVPSTPVGTLKSTNTSAKRWQLNVSKEEELVDPCATARQLIMLDLRHAITESSRAFANYYKQKKIETTAVESSKQSLKNLVDRLADTSILANVIERTLRSVELNYKEHARIEVLMSRNIADPVGVPQKRAERRQDVLHKQLDRLSAMRLAIKKREQPYPIPSVNSRPPPPVPAENILPDVEHIEPVVEPATHPVDTAPPETTSTLPDNRVHAEPAPVPAPAENIEEIRRRPADDGSIARNRPRRTKKTVIERG